MQADDLFWLTIGVIFLLSLVSALIRSRQRDPCLKLLHDHHISYLHDDGRVLWGDLEVQSSGLEVLFDAPYVDRAGNEKTSELVFDDDLARLCGVARTEHALTEKERTQRRAQIKRSFRPGPIALLGRRLRGVLNTFSDAVKSSLGVVAANAGSRGRLGAALGTQKNQLQEVGDGLIGFVANAYEPLLERHIGKPIVVEVKAPAGAARPTFEMPGFLVEYSDRFLAVFNVEQKADMELELHLGESSDGLCLSDEEGKLVLSNQGDALVVVRRIRDGTETIDVSCALFPGTELRLAHSGGDVALEVEKTRTLDLVVPRSRAKVRFGADAKRHRQGWQGMAPAMDEKKPDQA